MPFKIISVVESRSDLFKTAAICEAVHRLNRCAQRSRIKHILMHIRQAVSSDRCDIYFNDIDLPKPDVFLEVPSAAITPETTATIAERFSAMLVEERPEVVLITGDSNSALECALMIKRVAYERASHGKNFAPALAVIESGTKNFAGTAPPRQVNHVVLALLADYLFTSEENSTLTLPQGLSREKMHFVGSLNVDTLLRHRARAMDSSILNDLQLASGSDVKPFVLLTLQHLSGAAEQPSKLHRLQGVLSEIARQMAMVLPANPAVLRCIQETSLQDYFVDHFIEGPEPWDARVRIRVIPPLGYLDFVKLMAAAKVVLTDSPGIKEQATVLGVACIVLADGATTPARLVGVAKAHGPTDSERILEAFSSAQRGKTPSVEFPGGDGRAAQRVIEILLKEFVRGRLTRQAIDGHA